MRFKKIFCLIFCSLFLTSLSLSQSLVEVAKKEKERRESLKGKKSVVVTNADLTKVKKKPALTLPLPEQSEETQPESQAEKPAETTEAPQSVPSRARTSFKQSQELQMTAQKKLEEAKVDLEEKLRKATEYRELLELRMNALWQEFYSLDDMTSRDQIQRSIADTYLKLQAAQEEEAKAKEEYDKFLTQIQKETGPSLWIR